MTAKKCCYGTEDSSMSAFAIVFANVCSSTSGSHNAEAALCARRSARLIVGCDDWIGARFALAGGRRRRRASIHPGMDVRGGGNEVGMISADPPKRNAFVREKCDWLGNNKKADSSKMAWSGTAAFLSAADCAAALVTPIRGVRQTGHRRSLRFSSVSLHAVHKE